MECIQPVRVEKIIPIVNYSTYVSSKKPSGAKFYRGKWTSPNTVIQKSMSVFVQDLGHIFPSP